MHLKRHAQSSMLSSCPLAIWRQSYSSNLCLKHCFFGLKMQNSPCPGRGTPPPRPSLRSVASLTRNSPRRLLSEGFGHVELICFSYYVQILIWYFLIHDELHENCYEKIVIKVFKIRLILHYRASRIPELPGSLSGPRAPFHKEVFSVTKWFLSAKMGFQRQKSC